MHRNLVLHALTAIRDGDFSCRVPEEDDAEVAAVINEIAMKLQVATQEVGRVTGQVRHGKLGVHMDIGVQRGAWRELVGNVNGMSESVTSQFRELACVVTARANGDFSRRVETETNGEFLELASTLNVMGDQMKALTAEMSRAIGDVRRREPVQRVEVRGMAGGWKDVVEDMNRLSAPAG